MSIHKSWGSSRVEGEASLLQGVYTGGIPGIISPHRLQVAGLPGLDAGGKNRVPGT